MTHSLDLRGIACPLNFVKTKLRLDTMSEGEVLQVNLDSGEPIESVYASVQAEGHEVSQPEVKTDGSYLLTIKKKLVGLFLYCLISSNAAQAITAQGTATQPTVNQQSTHAQVSIDEQIKAAQEAVQLAPADTTKRVQLARLLKNSGNLHQAAIEYLNATTIDPACYIAYHELTQCKPTNGQIEEALTRLNKFDAFRPKRFLVKAALSELYERKGDYYQAARVLVDLQYSQGIPSKYAAQINTRIHNLLSKTRDIRTAEKAVEQKNNIEEAESTPNTPVPMPEMTDDKKVPISKLRNTRSSEGFGHADLLP